MKKCSVEGCENKHCCKGYCDKHYRQFKKHGHVLGRTRFDANEIIEHDDYAEMILYNEQGEEVARTLIDLEYVDIVKQYRWSLNTGYAYNSKVGLLHRFIMNPLDDLVVDHINHNRLDNRICNLRVCTIQENGRNSGIKCNNSSGVIGVHFHKESNRWVAQIYINNKNKHLGQFKTKEDAIEARKQAEIEYFGEYAPNTQD